MNWQGLLRNQWFQLCLVAACCSAGAGIFDLATIKPGSGPNPGPAPNPNPSPSAFTPLRPKKSGHWIVDASGAADSDSRNLNQVVQSATAGDTITIRPGSYNAAVVINRDLALIGDGAAATKPLLFFNRDQTNVVNIQAGHVTLVNLQIEQAFAGGFATFFCAKQARVELTNCIITSKATYNVSATEDSQLQAHDCEFRSSEVGAGLVYLGRARGTITRTKFAGNKWGLEVENQSQVNVDECTFQDNGDSRGYGTSVDANGSGATVNVQRSHFLENRGSVYAQESGNLTMTGCTFENNGISLEGDHVTGGLICVQSGAQATLTDLSGKSNKQGICLLTGGKAQLKNVNLSDTGIQTNNLQYQVFCNAFYLNGEGTTASIVGSTISGVEYNGALVMNAAKATIEKCTFSNSKYDGLVFGANDGTPGYGTITGSTISDNHAVGILAQSRSSIEMNGGEISNNGINGVEVAGSQSKAALSNLFVRNHSGIGLLAYSNGSITASHCTIEKNQFGVQAGLPGKGREFGGTIVLEASLVQTNTGYGAISLAGSTIDLKGNKFQNGRKDYLRDGGAIQK